MNISVFIPSYNQKSYLNESVGSVLGQTLRPAQIIIIDDASTDGSQELISAYKARYPDLVTAIYHEQNTGVAQVRIDALRAVTGDYVTYVDGDDRYLPTKLESEALVLRSNPGADIAFSNNYYLNSDGARIGIWAEHATPPQGQIFLQTFARDFPTRNLFRMELVNYRAWRAVGFYDTRLRLYEDFDMRIRLTRELRAVYCNQPLSEIRLTNKGLSTSNLRVHLECLDYIYRKNHHLLDDFDDAEETYARQGFTNWMREIAEQWITEAAGQKQLLEALRRWLIACRYGRGNWRGRSFARLVGTLLRSASEPVGCIR